MDFFKVKKFTKSHKPNSEKKLGENPAAEEPENGKGGDSNMAKPQQVDHKTEVEEVDEDDDDFNLDEVKRKLKELRRNSFMMLIPEEEPGMEEDEEEIEQEEETETSSSEWRDVEAEPQQPWCGFDAYHERYREQMLFFDRLSAQQLQEFGSHAPNTPSPRSTSKKLTSPLRCLSLKKMELLDDETEQLQHQLDNNPYHDIETAYVAQLCMSWEALHCQYTQLTQLLYCQPENPTIYNHTAQQFQQFYVMLQRYIENEPFEQGLRPEIYARSRSTMPILLQVPNIQGTKLHKQTEAEENDSVVLAADLTRIIEGSILAFHIFLKMDKKKTAGVRNMFGGQNLSATPVQQIQSSVDKKEMKLKELRKKMKGWKKRSWPSTQEGVQLLFGLIDFKVISRALRMSRITNEQLFWCEEKSKKLYLCDGKLQRDPSPILFPMNSGTNQTNLM